MKLFVSPDCGLCHEVKKLLARAGVRYVEYDVSTPEGMAEYCDMRRGDLNILPLLVEDWGQWSGEAAIGHAAWLAEKVTH